MKRLPAYGRELVAAQKSDRNVPWLLIALDWDIGRAMPRVVVAPGQPARDYDLRLVHGLECMVAHQGDAQRALDIAEQALRSGARLCPVIDMEAGGFLTTTEIIAMRGLASRA